MGGSKFKLSDMIPNAWFYKLKDMGKKKNQNLNHPKPKKQPIHLSSSKSSSLMTSNSMGASSSSGTTTFKRNSSSFSSSSLTARRKSQYFKRDLPTLPDTHSLDSPKISSRNRPSTRKNRASSPRIRRINPPAAAVAAAKPPAPESKHPAAPTRNSDVGITFDDQLLIRKDSNFSKVLNLQLPSIATKKEPKMKGTLEKERVPRDKTGTFRRRLSVATSPGMKLRANSPKIMNRKLLVRANSPKIMNRKVRANSPKITNRKDQGTGRRSWKKMSETYAVMITPANPRKDFMDSMMEMIVENDIKKPTDLEDLLAWYLQLNSNEYHEIIVDAFKEIWFHLADIRMKKKKKLLQSK